MYVKVVDSICACMLWGKLGCVCVCLYVCTTAVAGRQSRFVKPFGSKGDSGHWGQRWWLLVPCTHKCILMKFASGLSLSDLLAACLSCIWVGLEKGERGSVWACMHSGHNLDLLLCAQCRKHSLCVPLWAMMTIPHVPYVYTHTLFQTDCWEVFVPSPGCISTVVYLNPEW